MQAAAIHLINCAAVTGLVNEMPASDEGGKGLWKLWG